MRAAEWRMLGLGGLEQGGVVVATNPKDKKTDALAKASKHAEQRRVTQVHVDAFGIENNWDFTVSDD